MSLKNAARAAARIVATGLATLVPLTMSPAYARLTELPSIDASTGLPAWNQRFSEEVDRLQRTGSYPPTGVVECAETRELAGAYFCVFNERSAEMNEALLRVSLFVESAPKGTLLSREDARNHGMMKAAGGHDLKSQDIAAFHEAVSSKCLDDAGYCLNPHEEDLFDNFLLPRIREGREFVLITYAVKNGEKPLPDPSSLSPDARARIEAGLGESLETYLERLKSMPPIWHIIAGHEIHHAQYFLDEAYRGIVDRFWETEVTAEDKLRIREALPDFYNVEDDFLVKNEFQAYILQHGAEFASLKDFLPAYRQSLMDRLRDHPPIQVAWKQEARKP